MKVTIIIVALFNLYSKVHAFNETFFNTILKLTLSEDGKRSFTELAAKYGHKAEEHEITTEDGYILTMYHLPGDKTPVLLTHGLGADGDLYVIRGPGSLGIALANAGYDVWIGNNRGTKYGRRHVHLNPDTDTKFWDYSFHEMGMYDLPAMIDYVCYQTGKEKIFNIGHSEGATQFLVLMSQKPEYNNKLKLFIAMAPGCYFFNMPPFFQAVAGVGPVILGLLETLNIEELFRDRGAMSDIVKTVCSKGAVSYVLCIKAFVFPAFGFNSEGLEPEFLPTVIGHAPPGFSRKSLEHYDQLYLRKKFSQYDYGAIKNLVVYGTANPPDYNLKKITTKVAVLSGAIDLISLVENGMRLQKNLPNAVFEEIAKTTHVDFVIGKEADKYVFPPVFKYLEEHDF